MDLPASELAQPLAPQLWLLVRVGGAVLLGGLIGTEREVAGKPAGLRTHMLVAGTAALIVGLGTLLIGHFESRESSGVLRADPIRLLEALVTGVSFLGAGTIIRSREDHAVHGLTTAASLLFTAVVGATVALEQYVLAAGATLLLLLTLRAMGAVERRWVRGRKE
ncbi:MAG: MgtC/SapB family protein [Thermoanaerobaculia bacterium]